MSQSPENYEYTKVRVALVVLLYVAQDTEFLPALLPELAPPPLSSPSAASAGAAAESRTCALQSATGALRNATNPLLDATARLFPPYSPPHSSPA